jgi:hypothetical protein
MPLSHHSLGDALACASTNVYPGQQTSCFSLPAFPADIPSLCLPRLSTSLITLLLERFGDLFAHHRNVNRRKADRLTHLLGAYRVGSVQ